MENARKEPPKGFKTVESLLGRGFDVVEAGTASKTKAEDSA